VLRGVMVLVMLEAVAACLPALNAPTAVRDAGLHLDGSAMACVMFTRMLAFFLPPRLSLLPIDFALHR
jgi:hypothetical protein